ncbi:hypothetical protein IFM89_037643 [Coptis chinensis]|uniref:Cysteine protease n=1 Tax=Coptis chinensis TaxID=261450 RepID=A0A835IUY2_9MAGN|nr:hypothetical protein IFM89_037643 [Coptis chinensis]
MLELQKHPLQLKRYQHTIQLIEKGTILSHSVTGIRYSTLFLCIRPMPVEDFYLIFVFILFPVIVIFPFGASLVVPGNYTNSAAPVALPQIHYKTCQVLIRQLLHKISLEMESPMSQRKRKKTHSSSLLQSQTMNLLLLILLSTTLFIAAFASLDESNDNLIRQVVSNDDENDLVLNAHHHFSNFITKFGKKYADEIEHAYRFSVFKSNLQRAKLHQIIDPTAEHGVTKFSDLTPSEFGEKYLGLRSLKLPADAHKAPILPTNDLPTEFDWRDHGAVTPIKDQGQCGSCWSFSTTGALEGAHFLATGDLVSLSEQQLVDCDHENIVSFENPSQSKQGEPLAERPLTLCDTEEASSCDNGCNGGLMNSALEYTLKAGGLQREEDYPYTGKDSKCKFDKTKIAASVSNFSVISIDEEQIAANLVKNGPLAVGINAAYMQTYRAGVSCPYICSKRRLDHAILLVGFGSAGFAPIRLKEKPYWILKNSWGQNWGEDGFYKICRGPDVCGVDSMVSTVAAVQLTPK